MIKDQKEVPTGHERRQNERIPCEAPILHNTSPPDFFTKVLCTTSAKRDCISNPMKTC